MKDQIELINKRANEFLETISQYKTIAYTTEIKVPNYLSVLNAVTMKIENPFINFLNMGLDKYSEIIGGWDKVDFSEIIGSGMGDGWIVINKNSLEIEERINNYNYMEEELLFKIAINEKHFIEILIELAKYEFETPAIKGINLAYVKNIYKRRALAEKYAHMAGGDDYYEYWKYFWNALTDREIIETGPEHYGLDLPDIIKQEGDKYVWV